MSTYSFRFSNDWLLVCVQMAAALCLSITLNAQTPKMVVIELENSSFEGLPSMGRLPDGWFDCSSTDESPPDIQPGQFGVATLPKHGESYIGMVVRDNDTWEAVGQKLKLPLQKDHCYDFAVDLCRAETYISPSRKTKEVAHYTTAVKILIWGGTDYCEKGELLGESALITNPKWMTFMFQLRPKKDSYRFLVFEAYYQTPIIHHYNGNVLMDNATIIQEVNCSSKPVITPTKHDSVPDHSVYTTIPNQKSKDAAQVYDNLAQAKKGEIVHMDGITFQGSSDELSPGFELPLQELFDFLSENPEVIIEVGGHTNGIALDDFYAKLAKARAKKVANWLIEEGIASERVQYKGYSKRKKLASDSTQEGRNQNQRIEVTILKRNE
jgi:outer membrane protein OmpA-like peptidoglycan-associated protein